MNPATLAEALSHALRVPGNAPLLLSRESPSLAYKARSYSDVADAAAELSAGLASLGLRRRATLAIASANCPEWLIADFACTFGDFVNVGLHLEWHIAKLADIIQRAEVECILVSDAKLSTIRDAVSTLRGSKPLLVRMPGGETPAVADCEIMEWSEVIARGKHTRSTHTGYGFEDDIESCSIDEAGDETDAYTLMFSSGTSGGPPKATVCSKKGWQSSNCNPGPFANIADVNERRAVSYLSLCHGADRGIAWQAVFAGGTIGFARGEEDLEGCLEDIEVLRPVFFLGMASFWTALFQRHVSSLFPLVDAQLLAMLQSDSAGALDDAGIVTASDAQRLFLSEWDRLRAAFLATRRGGHVRKTRLDLARREMGGELTACATGGSKTPAQVLEFMHFVLADGCSSSVKDAYGLTEFPGIAVNGNINDDVELKLVATGSGEYAPEDAPYPRGEILVRRKDKEHTQYWKDEGKTKESWDDDGWFHTGDVGQLSWHVKREPNSCHERRTVKGHAWTPQPSLQIIDRVGQLEELYIAGDSVWVATQHLETDVFGCMPEFSHVLLVGDRNEGRLVAIAVLNPRNARRLSRGECLALLQAKGNTAGLREFEVPVNVVVEQTPWTQRDGLITLTGKVNRAAVKERYRDAWTAALYQPSLAPSSPPPHPSLAPSSTPAHPSLAPSLLPSQPATDTAPAPVGRFESGRSESERVSAAAVCVETLREKLQAEADGEGCVEEGAVPVAIKRGRREADCRVRRRVKSAVTVREDSGKETTRVEEQVEIGESVRTVRGRDWLADRAVSESETELKFAISGLCAREDGEWDQLDDADAQQLARALEEVRAAALHIRESAGAWKETYDAARRAAVAEVESAVEGMREQVQRGVEHARRDGDVRGVVRAFRVGRRRVERAKQRVQRVQVPLEQSEALMKLDDKIMALRVLGDALDVNMLALPVAWRLDLDWVLDAWRTQDIVMVCPFGCKQHVFQSQLGEHVTAEGCSDRVGVTDAPLSAEQGTSMGGDTAVFCELTGATIDTEASDLLPDISPTMSAAERNQPCPSRARRYHAVGSGKDRLPWAHEDLSAAWEIASAGSDEGVSGQKLLARMVGSVDAEVWAEDKQGPFWLFRYVKYAQAGELPRNTPPSLVTRACEAFARRPCLGVPDLDLLPAVRASMPRETSLDVLPTAAGLNLTPRDSFRWLMYADLGLLVRRVAHGLIALGLPPGSFVAVSGYNDLEFVVADFAIAVAGMVSVPVHGTYQTAEAAAVLNTSGCVALACMRDHAHHAARDRRGRWHVQGVLERCRKIQHVVVMDGPSAEPSHAIALPAGGTLASMPHWVCVDPAASASDPAIPDPFYANGAHLAGTDVDEGSRVTTVLFTSGSSGQPKAVAIGVDEFCLDVMGEKAEEKATSQSLTVSYISLSHGSDRFKVWSHIVHGGRVGFCFYGAENWAWREADKTADAGCSPIELLFQQVSLLRPTSMSCPPNIWGGLRAKYDEAVAANTAPHLAMQAVAAVFGLPPRMKTLATGGAPTSAKDLRFAEQLSYVLGAALSNSYGTTETGAVTMDGRQPHPKYADVEVQLVDCRSFTSSDKPVPRGEVVVSCPRLALGYLGDEHSTRQAFFRLPAASTRFPDDSASAFQDNVKHLAAGRWYRTGDLGSFDRTGKLVLHGRVSSQLVRGVSVDELEAGVEGAVGGGCLVCVAERADQSIVCLVSVPDSNGGGNDSSALRDKCSSSLRARLDGSAEPDVEVVVDAEEWRVENGMLTVSLKKRRQQVLRKFAPLLSQLAPRP